MSPARVRTSPPTRTGSPRSCAANGRAAYPEATFQGVPSRSTDGGLYPNVLVSQLIALAGGFALRRRQNAPPRPPSPKSIMLIYVPSCDEERLLEAFDFAVMPAPATSLSAYGEGGKQLRHNADAAYRTLLDIVSPASLPMAALAEVSQRLRRLSDKEALLLPPLNFFLRDQRRIHALFLEFRRGQRPATDRFDELVPKLLNRDDIPRLGAKSRTCQIDARNIAFLNAHPTAFHAMTRELDHDDKAELISALRTLYRFGAALDDGFHHDAQRADGLPLKNISFECRKRGQHTLSAPYVNIYPDDFIRPGN